MRQTGKSKRIEKCRHKMFPVSGIYTFEENKWFSLLMPYKKPLQHLDFNFLTFAQIIYVRRLRALKLASRFFFQWLVAQINWFLAYKKTMHVYQKKISSHNVPLKIIPLKTILICFFFLKKLNIPSKFEKTQSQQKLKWKFHS